MSDVDPWEEGPGADRGADERTQLTTYLDYLRDTVVRKVEGLSEEDAHRSVVPSGWSLVGLVSHLTDVETNWLRDRFAGEDITSYAWTDDDPDGEWRVGADVPAADVVTAYREACRRTSAVIAAHDLDARSVRPERTESLRFVVLHLIAETARHAGHADVARELLDGAVGE